MRFTLKTALTILTLVAIAAIIGSQYVPRNYPISIVVPSTALPVNDGLNAAFNESDELRFR